MTATFAGIGHVAKNRVTWLENFYQVHADWVNRKTAPYAFVLPAGQRDPFETYELLDILRTGEVEIHQAKAPFTAGGSQYAAGSWVIKLAQPYGAFAKTMLEKQVYPDLRLFPRRTAEAAVRRDRAHARPADGRRGRSDRAAVRGDARAGADAPSRADADAGAAEVGVSRRTGIERGVHRGRAPAGGGHRRSTAPRAGSTTPAARCARHVDRAAVAGGDDAFSPTCPSRAGLAGRGRRQTGPGRRLSTQAGDAHRLVAGREQHAGRLDEVAVRAVRLQPPHDRVDRFQRGPRRAVRRHRSARRHQPRARSSRASIPSGTTRSSPGPTASATPGWKKLGDWVRGGGTLVAIGSAVATARALLDLPIEPVLPVASGGRRGGGLAAANCLLATRRA